MIALESVTKTYQSGRRTIRALDDVSFRVEPGAFAVVMGKSGSGKSTLLNCIGGLEAPDAGTVTCLGRSLTDLLPRRLSRFQRRRIGFVFQAGNLLSYLTVAENIGFPLFLNRVAPKERARRIAELLEQIGLPSASGALPHELSGGETQRVALARAIAHRPGILLADEPTGSLDTATGHAVVRLMRDMGRDHNCTIVVATHDPEIGEAADALIRLKDGCILSSET